MSKLGFCSRSQARSLILGGHVLVNGHLVRNPEQAVDSRRDRFTVDGQNVHTEKRVYLALNKPRGLVTTAADEHGRATVYDCFQGAPELPRVFPVGRLDKSSEGLLLFTNDTAWGDAVTEPRGGIDKTYHVQVDCVADEALARRVETGTKSDGELLAAKRASVLRQGEKNSWLEIVLDEGRNRHIRRLLAALGINVLRLVRITIGPIQLGNLEKGHYRHLTPEEVRSVATACDHGPKR